MFLIMKNIYAIIAVAIWVLGASRPVCAQSTPDSLDHTTWTINPADYDANMIINAVINIEGIESMDANDKIAAFIGGSNNLRGVGQPVFVPGINRYVVSLFVYAALTPPGGGTADPASYTIRFRVYDASTGVNLPCTTTIPFIQDGIVGTLSSPDTIQTIRIEIDFNKDDVLCAADDHGYAKANVSGGTPPFQYLWSTGVTTDSIAGLSAGKYYLSVTDRNNFTKVDSVTIVNTNRPIISPLLVAAPGTAVCQNTNVFIFAFSTEQASPVYQWYDVINNQIHIGPSLSMLNLQASTQVYAETSVRNCLSARSNISIAVSPAPNASFALNNSIAYTLDLITYAPAVVDPTASYQWEFGDGNSSTLPNPQHRYQAQGNYLVRLTVTTADGCTAQTTQFISIRGLDLGISFNATKPACATDPSGEIGVQVTNGIEPFTFSWSNGATTDRIIDLLPGNYSVTVEDGQGNVSSAAFQLRAEEPDWSVDPADFIYSMNMSLRLNIEGQFSTDSLDLVAAFIGTECRGVGYVRYSAAANAHIAFITVYSNNLTGDQVSFRIWDASACLLYTSTAQTFPFIADGLVGSPLVPQVINTVNLVQQVIYLNPGWNWFSYNLSLPDPAINSALASLSAPQGGTIKGQSLFSQYFDAAGFWVGSLQELSHLRMYQYRAPLADSLFIIGNPVNPATTPVSLATGWNWIGFLPKHRMQVDTALQSLYGSSVSGDVIKSRTAFAQFVPGQGWIGNLRLLEPTKGYILYRNSGGTLSYPANFSSEEEISARVPEPADNSSTGTHWQVDPLQYEHTMNIIAVVRDGELPNCLSEGDEVGAFVNGQLRGANKPIYIPQLDTWLLFLTVYANEEGENLQFIFFDTSAAQEIPVSEQIVFIANRIVGSIELPRILTLATPSAVGEQDRDYGLSIYPNPATERVFLQLRLPEAQALTVSVTDALGRQVHTFAQTAQAGQNLLEWKPAAALPAGWYTITLQTAAGVISRRLQIVKP